MKQQTRRDQFSALAEDTVTFYGKRIRLPDRGPYIPEGGMITKAGTILGPILQSPQGQYREVYGQVPVPPCPVCAGVPDAFSSPFLCDSHQYDEEQRRRKEEHEEWLAWHGGYPCYEQ